MFVDTKTPVSRVQSLSNKTGQIHSCIGPENFNQTLFIINHIAVSMFCRIRAAIIFSLYYYE
jgi:hypothetical protein